MTSRTISLLAAAALTGPVAAHPVITEFLAENDRGLRDADQQRQDWIEIHNPGPGAVDLSGYYLSDDPLLPQKWAFPPRVVEAGGFVTVFASGPGAASGPGELHAGFKLNNQGGWLGLSGPGGYLQDFGASYPPQVADVSRGTVQTVQSTPLISISSPVSVLIPASSGELPADWQTVPFAAPAATGTLGAGYESTAGPYAPLLGTNLLAVMPQQNASAFIQAPFTVPGNPADIQSLKLRMRYDDGFVAWLNGTEIARRRAPASLQWDSAAVTSLLAHWTMDSADITGVTVRDIAGGYHGTAMNGPASSPGVRGEAIVFAGGDNNSNSQYINLAAHIGTISALTQGTLAAWVKPDPYLPTSPIHDVYSIFTVSNGSIGTGEMRFYVNNTNDANRGKLVYGRRSATANAAVDGSIMSSSANLFDGNWHHVAATVSSAGLVTLYIDGIHQGSSGADTIGFLNIIGANSAAIGRNRDNTAPATPLEVAGQWFFDGAMDDVRLYSAPLTAAEVAALAAPGPVSSGMEDETLDLTAQKHLLVSGANMLAIQGLNASAGDADFLILPELHKEDLTTGPPGYFLTPSPGAANPSAGISDPQALVTFAPDGGVFTTAQTVTLSTTAAGEIRYTLDGTEPTAASLLYTAPLNLTASSEVRARVFKAGESGGRVTAAGFIKLGADVQSFTSPLPVLVIENFNRGAIPNYRAANPPAGDGSGLRQVMRQPGSLALFTPAAGTTSLTTSPALHSRLGMRVRGSSSAGSQPALKQNLSVETWGKFDENSVNIAPLGLPNESDWVLYAPYNYDRAMVRNAVAFELMRRTGHWAPGTRFVEVFTNTGGSEVTMADFAGVFVLIESIKADNDRVDLKDLSDDGTTGGWMVLSDRMDALAEDGRTTPPWNFHTAGPNRVKQGPYGGSSGTDQGGDDVPTGYNTFLNFAEPSGYDTTAAQRSTIVAWFDSMENVLYSANWRDPAAGWAAWLDRETWVDHYLLANLTRNVDDLQLSTHLYRKHEGDLLHLNPPWDYDRSMDSYDSRDDSTSGHFGQNYLWYPRLFTDPCFAQAVIDRWQEMRRGSWSNAALTSLIDGYAAEITAPVAAANFAKWNASNNTPRAGGWPAEITALKTWLTARANWIDSQYVAAPAFSHPGGEVTAGTNVSITAPAGTIHYATGGNDPLQCDAAGLSIAPHALIYSSPLTVNASTILTARVFTGTAWSGPVTVSYTIGTVPAAAGNVLISEIHYHPANPTAAENPDGIHNDADYEFVEVLNVSAATVNLTGCQLAEDVQFTFPAGTLLAPGQRVVVVENTAAFRLRYGTGPVVIGEYSGNLSNAGNSLALLAAGGADIQRFTFDDTAPWPVTPDGSGPSLVLEAPESLPDAASAGNWRASFVVHGTPGSDDRPTFAAWATANNAGGMLDDGDRDGLPELAEFMLGGDPHSSSQDRLPQSSIQSHTVAGVPGDYATLTFRRLTDPAGVTVSVQFSAELASWNIGAVKVSETDAPDGTTMEVWRSASPVATQPRLFGRVQFTTP